jgi:4'-phosphopantetheinyl transferase
MLAYGFADDIGMDVETVRDGYDPEMILRRYFSAAESAEWAGLPPDDRVRGFFRAWTRKEAILKATGLGIAGLEQFEVSFAPKNRKALRKQHQVPGAEEIWWFADFEPEIGYLASVTAPFFFEIPTVSRFETAGE